MNVMSSPSGKMSWQTRRERASVLAALALRKETVSRLLVQIRTQFPGEDGEALGQEAAARKVGVSLRQWQRWEAGDSVPYPRNLGTIAETFGIDINDFYETEVARKTPTPFPDRTQLDRIEANQVRLEAKLDRILSALGATLEPPGELGDLLRGASPRP